MEIMVDVHGLSIAMLNNQRVLPEKLQWMEEIMACTADEDAVGYLNAIDERFRSAGWLRGRPGGENPWHRSKFYKVGRPR